MRVSVAGRRRGFSRATALAAPPERVWADVTRPATIDDELRPFLRMTFPAGVGALTPETVPLGRTLCRSWVLLLGVLPVEWDDLAIVELEPGHRFLERSTLATQREWTHHRRLDPLPGGGTLLTDELAFVPRLAPLGALHEATFRLTFWWRHRRLAARYGRAAQPLAPARSSV